MGAVADYFRAEVEAEARQRETLGKVSTLTPAKVRDRLGAIAVADYFRPEVEREAKEHQQRSPGRGKKVAQIAQPIRVEAKLAFIARTGARTLEKATAVVRAAEKAPKPPAMLYLDTEGTDRDLGSAPGSFVWPGGGAKNRY